MKTYDFCAAVAVLTGRPANELLGGKNPLVVIEQNAEGEYSISKWDDTLGEKPTIEALLARATKLTD